MNCTAARITRTISSLRLLFPVFWSNETTEGSHIVHEYCSHSWRANTYSHCLLMILVNWSKEGLLLRLNKLFLETNEWKRRKSREPKLSASPRVLWSNLVRESESHITKTTDELFIPQYVHNNGEPPLFHNLRQYTYENLRGVLNKVRINMQKIQTEREITHIVHQKTLE